MTEDQEKSSYIERKAESLVILRHLDFNFTKASDILQIPEAILRNWVDNFDDTWKDQIPDHYLQVKRFNSSPASKKTQSEKKVAV
jgi:hypothetical protein